MYAKVKLNQIENIDGYTILVPTPQYLVHTASHNVQV